MAGRCFSGDAAVLACDSAGSSGVCMDKIHARHPLVSLPQLPSGTCFSFFWWEGLPCKVK